MKRTLLTFLKIGISLVLIGILIRFGNLDLSAIWAILQKVHPLYAGLAFALYICAICLGCYKWQLLLHPLGLRVRLLDLISYTFVGLFIGNFLPSAMVGGDAVRAFNLARSTGRPAEVATSVTVDRFIGLFGFMGMAVIMAIIAVVGQHLVELQGLLVATAIAFAFLTAIFIILLSSRMTRRGGSLLFSLPVLERLRPQARVVYGALQTYSNSLSSLGLALLVGFGVQILTVFVNWLVAVSLNPHNPINIFYFFLFNPLVAFVPLVPVAFNGIGPVQYAYVFFFDLVHVPKEISFAISIIMQAIIISSSLPGGVFLWLRRAIRPESTITTPRQEISS